MAASALAVRLIIVFGGGADGEPGGSNDQLGKAPAESVLALTMAEAQHRQALSGYWPQVSLKAGYVHMSDSPEFLFPENFQWLQCPSNDQQQQGRRETFTGLRYWT
ncbi:MAG: hypothetical protein P4L55_08995 [Syntrophobacteraceae bacterium]|nr:hypothetical protein [Syntrophobacteraceae bacterium]